MLPGQSLGRTSTIKHTIRVEGPHPPCSETVTTHSFCSKRHCASRSPENAETRRYQRKFQSMVLSSVNGEEERWHMEILC